MHEQLLPISIEKGFPCQNPATKVKASLVCKANELLEYANRQFITDAPKTVVDAFKTGGVAKVFPENKGEMAQAMSEFMTNVNGVFSAVKSLHQQVMDSSLAIASAESQPPSRDCRP